MELLKRIGQRFLYSHLFLGLCAVAMVQSTRLLFSLPLALTPVTWLVAALTVSYYNLHKYAGHLSLLSLKAFVRSCITAPVRPFDRILFVLSILWVPVFFYRSGWTITLLSSAMALVSMAYSVPAVPTRNGNVRLRELVYLKLTVLSFVWAVMTVILPLLEAGIGLTGLRPVLLTVNVAGFIYLLCIPFELRDLHREEEKGVRTFAVLHGERVTRRVAYAIAILLVVLHHLPGYLEPGQSWMLSVVVLLSLVWIPLEHPLPQRWFYKAVVDGMMLLRFFVLYIFSKA
jgi:4-hydroxybenzoate polyprenyltransferase